MHGPLERRFTNLRGLISPTVLIVAWIGALEFGIVRREIMPTPEAVAWSLAESATTGELFLDCVSTVGRVAIGIGLGISLGILLGIATARNAFTRDAIEPLLNFARPMPAIALVPLFAVWFGIGEVEKLAVIGWASCFPMWLATHSGISRLPAELEETASLFGATRRQILFEVALPWATPALLAGTRTALGTGFTAVVAAEMSGASYGLGFRVLQSALVFRIDHMIAALFLLAFLCLAADALLKEAFLRQFPWAGGAQRV